MADIIVFSDVDTFMQSANQSAMRTNVGFGTIVTQNSDNVSITGGSITGITDLAVADGGTGSSTASGARTNLEVYSDSEVDAKLATKETAGGVQMSVISNNGRIDTGITGVASYLLGGVYTYSFWFKDENSGSSSLLLGSESWSSNGFVMFLQSSSNQLRFQLSTALSNNLVLNLGSTYRDGKWRQFTFTSDWSSNDGTVAPVMSFYIDGQSVSPQTLTSYNGTYDYVGNSGIEKLWIGNLPGSNAGCSSGIRGFRVFNRALSAAEVADLYETGVVAVADRWGGTEIPDWSSTVDGWTGASYSISQEASFTDSASVTKNNVVTGTLSAVGEAIFTNNNPKFGAIGQVTKLSGWVYSDTADIKIAPRGSPTHSNVSGSVVPTSGEWTQFTAFSQTQVSGYRYSFSITNNLGGNLPAGAVVKFADVEATTLGAIADLPLDEGIGYQFHDRSSNHFDALASLTGVTHLVPKANGKVRVKAANASSAMYMLRADSILPENSIVSNVLSEQCYVDLTNSAQTLNDYRIRLNPSGSDLQIQRSDGSNHQTLGTVTAPSSLSDVDVQINYKQIAQ